MIRLAHPVLTEELLDQLRPLLANGLLTSGRLVGELESGLSARLGGREVVLVSSGTTAALIGFHLLREAGVKRVLMPDFTFPSVAASALRVGLEVVLTDIDARLLSLPAAALDRWPRGPENAFLSIDQFGIPGPNATLQERAREGGWRWFEDAACAQGSHRDAVPCGTQATVAILSFHPRKVMTTAEGGALVLQDPILATQARELRSLGLTGDGLQRQFTALGYNARLSDVHAAIGLNQLPRVPDMVAQRRRLGAHYLAVLDDWGGVAIPGGFREPGANFQSLVVLLPPGANREGVARQLHGRGIESTLPGFAIHTQPAFAGLERMGPLLRSLALHERGLALPLHDGMTTADVDRVVTALRHTLSES
jgi:perosamine synthetase